MNITRIIVKESLKYNFLNKLRMEFKIKYIIKNSITKTTNPIALYEPCFDKFAPKSLEINPMKTGIKYAK
jgi:hypothetical protein